MHKLLFAACLTYFSVSAMATCDDVKSQIDAKLQAKGVTAYSLDIVPVAPATTAEPAAASGAAAAPAKAPSGKVVGNCDNETKQIIYTRK